MKIKARLIALGHMGDVYFDMEPSDVLTDSTKISEANKLIRKEVESRILTMDFKPCGTVKTLIQITWEIIQ